MDRQTIYYGQIAREVDLLLAQRNALVGLAKLASGVLGATTIVNSFTVIPTVPASLNVTVTPGEVYQIENIEQSSWSSLGADTHSILKQGMFLDAQTFGITPPSTVGYSQNFLVEVQYQDVDGGSLVLPYYNAANPAVPFSGPGNAGTAQNTVRSGVAALQVKAGIAAPTGTQTTPTADAGWTGIYVVTVANGATTITSGNITQLLSAPWIISTLPNVPSGVQSGAWQYGQDTGSINLLAATLYPIPTAYTAGMPLKIRTASAPTGPASLNINGLGAKSIAKSGGAALSGGEWQLGDVISVVYDGTNFQLQGSQSSGGGLVYLSAPRTYYVNAATGNDSADGLAAVAGSGHAPFATIQRAIAASQAFNLNGFNITISVADGSYTGPVTCPNANGSGSILLTGNHAAPGNVSVASSTGSAFIFNGGPYIVDGFKPSVSATAGGDPGDGIHTSAAGNVTINAIAFGACVSAHFGGSGSININGPIILATGANAKYHMQATVGGKVTLNPTTPPNITINGATTFSVAFVEADNLGVFYGLYGTITGAGNVTGPRYQASTNGIVNSLGGGANYFPGTVAGSTSSGGQYA